MTAEPLGLTRLDTGCWRAVVWAPRTARVDLVVEATGHAVALERGDRGYHVGETDLLAGGERYWLRLDGGPVRADPASRWQPDGLAGPSACVDPRELRWTDAGWRGVPLERSVFYELHVGTFSAGGTFDDVVAHLDDLAGLGVSTIEVMPLAQFPGERNWGYDGVLPFAVQHSYGGPAGLARLVDACHARGMALIVDVVYNHVGPEGNHLGEFGPYFTDLYRTPWGDAINLSGRGSDEVRRYFLDSARWLIRDLHVDGLRVDAVHAITDPTALPFVEQLCDVAHDELRRLGRVGVIVAESASNDPRTVRPPERGGFGFDAQWNDDVHHSLHVALTGEHDGYYGDYRGVDDYVRCVERRFAVDGRWSEYRQRHHGREARDLEHHRLVAFVQNHDQIGNRMLGERLSSLVSFEAQKAAAALVALGPFTPLLFMGEEYGETAPFPYFVDHADPALLDAVREGRRAEFARFAWHGEPPDPAAPSTFRAAVLDRDQRHQGRHRLLWELNRELFRLRREEPSLETGGSCRAQAGGDAPVIVLARRASAERALIVANLSPEEQPVQLPDGDWAVAVDTAAPRWGGPGESDPVGAGRIAPWSAVCLVARREQGHGETRKDG